MLAREHLAYGLTLGIALSIAFNNTPYFDNKVIAIGGAVFGSLLADIDEPKSTMGNLLPVLSHFINKIFGHRGLLHDIAIFVPLGIFLIIKNPLITGFIIGYWSHLLLDSMTIEGIPFLGILTNPKGTIKNNFHLFPKYMRFKANSNIAKIVTIILIIFTIIVTAFYKYYF